MFTAVGQTLKQYVTGGQGSAKNVFLNSAFYQLDKLSISIRTFQNIFTLNELISGKNQPTTQYRQSKAFCKNMAKSDKQNPFYFAANPIKASKFVN